MHTVKFKTHDPRLTLFADEQTFLVGTFSQHINTDKAVNFAGQSIKAGVIFNSLGENKMAGDSRFLQAKTDHYYRVVGIMDNVNTGISDNATLVLFSAFTINGPVLMDAFAKAHKVNEVFYALQINDKGQFVFLDSNKKQGAYKKSINILNPDDDLILLDEQ